MLASISNIKSQQDIDDKAHAASLIESIYAAVCTNHLTKREEWEIKR